MGDETGTGTVIATGATTNYDESYTYDNLDRLMKMNRGTLVSGTITAAAATYTQRWDGVGSGTGKGLDPLGNWQNLVTDPDGGGAGAASSQSRTHDSRNQLTNVAASTLTFDANGNTTTDETGKQFVYDAWNKLAVGKTAGGSVLVSYEYDALKRRITTTPNGGTARDDYHSAAWQVIEERESSTVKNQYVWSLAYVDAMVLRDRDAAAGGNLGTSGSGLDERLYAQQDANYNVTSLIDTSGIVIERYRYLPYGTADVRDANWGADADGNSDVGWSHLHQGARLDSVTNLYQLRHRELSTTLGRWLQTDPLGYHDALNLYADRQNSPLDAVDPLGLKRTCVYTGDSHFYIKKKTVKNPNSLSNYDVYHCKCRKICVEPSWTTVTMDCGQRVTFYTGKQWEEWDEYNVDPDQNPNTPGASLDNGGKAPYQVPSTLSTYESEVAENFAMASGGNASGAIAGLFANATVPFLMIQSQEELDALLAVREQALRQACAKHCAALTGM